MVKTGQQRKEFEFFFCRFDEMGEYDVPAFINYILQVTGRSKLSYIGHSMGCTAFFIAMIKHQELNSRIDSMVALAPASNLQHMRGPLRILAYFAGLILVICKLG